jgi:hypothetical protein
MSDRVNGGSKPHDATNEKTIRGPFQKDKVEEERGAERAKRTRLSYHREVGVQCSMEKGRGRTSRFSCG